jgi:beta-galactosidase
MSSIKHLSVAALFAAAFIAGSACGEPAYTRSLNGEWSFRYMPGLVADFPMAGWATIAVPANWEMKGFAEPSYGDDLKDGTGFYRRTFQVPLGWQGRRTFLRFEGVAFGYEVWVNEKKAGESSASAFNRHTFDVTPYLLPGGDNVLAVRVTTKPKGFEFDLNDDWSLSGIYRDVTLFSVPATHVQDVSARTTLVQGGGADLSVDVTLSQADAEVRASLLGPDGRSVGDTILTRAGDVHRSAVIHVARPRLWTAETPALYRLRLTVAASGKPLQAVEQRIGLREVSIAGGVLLLNGRPIKMRGVNHHELDPETGRAVTEAQMRQDLALMKKANVNFVRTSHYPPHPRFLELCDELGFYVMDEVAIGHGEKNLEKPDYRAAILARVEPTIVRDKNHASVLIWSIGNENPITEVELEAGRMAKALDPTRPITYPKIGSYFLKNFERLPDFVDIYAPHYPSNATLQDYAHKLKRPTILTEYAHGLGLATDRIQAQWDIIQANPVFAGGAIWHFHDQGLLRTSGQQVDADKPTQLAWVDKFHHYDTHGMDGADGMTYADRTPQIDYWQMRKVYAPVQFTERSTAGRVALTVENRYDFRTLGGIKLLWSLQRNGREIRQGRIALRAAARGQETVAIPVSQPASDDIMLLQVRAIDEHGMQINERNIRLNGAGQGWTTGLPAMAEPVVTESDSEVKVALPQWTLSVQRASGQLSIRDHAGKVLVAGLYPHTGRKPTMAEALRSKTSPLWLSSILETLEQAVVKVERREGKVVLSVAGQYRLQDAKAVQAAALQVAAPSAIADDLVQGAGKSALPGNGSGGVEGGYQLEIAANGSIAVSYDFAPVHAVGRLSEAGFTVMAPAGVDEFRWVGQGPFAGYPGKDRLNEFGIYHLNRADLRFQGNRRATELALLTTAGGAGFAMAAPAADVAVERSGERTLLSHNALIGGPGNKGTSPEVSFDAGKVGRIAGAFTLLPVGESWPPALARWFGKPGPARDVFRPFYHSYDQ